MKINNKKVRASKTGRFSRETPKMGGEDTNGPNDARVRCKIAAHNVYEDIF